VNSPSSRAWQFYNPVSICFGRSSRAALLPLVDGKRLLCVTTQRGRERLLADPVLRGLEDADLIWMDCVSSNPGLLETQTEIDRLTGKEFDAIVAFGGGSSMDVAKALSAALAPGLQMHNLKTLISDPEHYLDHPMIPVHALPTTAGTGAEVTPFATIWDYANRRKLSLSSPRLFPTTAIVDPDLMFGLPRDTTVSTGLDALNQAFESLWNKNRTPISQSFATRSIGLALNALPRLAEDIYHEAARVDMAEASMLAGISISQTRTALCHSMSYPLTAHFGLAHGWACATVMDAVAELAFSAAPALFDIVARNVGLLSAAELLAQLKNLLDLLEVKSVATKAINGVELAIELIPEMINPGRSDNFIVPVDPGKLETILRTSLE
jgi:alcohol dehydrogenase